MLKELQDPSQVVIHNRALALHPTSLKKRRFRRALAVGGFFVSLIAAFLFLIWLANRYPAPAGKPHHSYRGEVK